VARADAGEPYDDADARAVVDTLEHYHSAYWIDSSTAPAPLFVASGFDDDLFPIDEALRYVNRTRRQHPRVPVAAMFGDFGHQRASNKKAERARLVALIHRWMDRYLRGRRTGFGGVIASTQTCPRDARSEGPFKAKSFAALARGEVRFRAGGPAKTITADGGDPRVGAAIDPVGGGGDACARTDAADQAGTATYRLPPSKGYLLLGAPTILAHLKVTGSAAAAQIAGRLWDVAPDGQQTLVARGEYRPTAAARGEVWQLHANGWRFKRGHVPKLELLGSSPPSSRKSNGDFEITVTKLSLRLPVRDRPNRRGVRRAAPLVLPPGQVFAPGARHSAL
jgi:predicted acyl esterase